MQCPNCGTENAAGTVFCTSCGRSLSVGSRPFGPHLRWQAEDGTLRTLPLTRSITIGRVEGNDIVLSEPAMSRQHARVDVAEEGLTVFDLGSLNGTFVNGERLSAPHQLQDGDVIGVGQTPLTVVIPQPAPMAAPAEPAQESELVDEPLVEAESEAPPVPVEELDDRTVLAADLARASEASSEEAHPPVEVGPVGYLVSGNIRTPIYERLTVGRAEGNDIRLENDRLISRNHARLEAGLDGVWLEDLKSANGTYVNGERVSEPVKLDEGAVVRFGSSEFRFELPGPAGEAPPGTEGAPSIDEGATIVAQRPEEAEEETLQGSEADVYIREAELAEFQRLRGGGETEPTGEIAGAADQHRLVVNFGAEAGRAFALHREVTVIGRTSPDADYDIQLDDRAISRPHAKIVKQPYGFEVQDLDSANGTWVNYTEEITAPRRLTDGDILKVGKTTLVYRVPAALRPEEPVRTLDPTEGQILAFFSLKGGVGTTTLAVNFAVVLRQITNDRVLLIDLSTERGAASVHMNLAPKLTLADLPSQSSVIDIDALQTLVVTGPGNVDVLPSPPSPQTAELVSPAAVSAMLPLLKSYYKWVVVDTSPTFSELNLGVFDLSDLLFIVCTPDVTTLKVTQATLDTFAALMFPSEKRVLVLNQTHPKPHIEQDDMEKAMGERIGLSLAYAGDAVLDSTDRGVPLALNEEVHPMIAGIRDFASNLAAVKVTAQAQARRGGFGHWVQGVIGSLRR